MMMVMMIKRRWMKDKNNKIFPVVETVEKNKELIIDNSNDN